MVKREGLVHTNIRPFKHRIKSTHTIFVYPSTKSGRIKPGIPDVGSEYGSNMVVLSQPIYWARSSEPKETWERGRDRKWGADRYDILPVLFLRLSPTDITGSRLDEAPQHLVHAAWTSKQPPGKGWINTGLHWNDTDIQSWHWSDSSLETFYSLPLLTICSHTAT